MPRMAPGRSVAPDELTLPTTSRMPPLAIVHPLITPPKSRTSVPPPDTVPLSAVPPELDHQHAAAMHARGGKHRAAGQLGGAAAVDRPAAARPARQGPGPAGHLERGEADVLLARPNCAEIEAIRSGAAQNQRVAAGLRIDNSRDSVAGCERQRVAAAVELDRRTAARARSRDGAGIENAHALRAGYIDADRAGDDAGIVDAAGEGLAGDVDRGRVPAGIRSRLSTKMPWLVATMLPEFDDRAAYGAVDDGYSRRREIVPELKMFPEKVETGNRWRRKSYVYRGRR